ncbi:hypothetical protein [Collimonas sp.]|uniref:hypothetical protein n=1 Tax=Collimonas sp. TaxID=1963772 RepID=UPI002BB47C3C|nr:hypothetical protein [Collimonas sp.]HWW08235.1 hypothetical protein [Collimonas sp.]
MSTFQSKIASGSNGYPAPDNPGARSGGSAMIQGAQQGSAEAMEFQLWVSQQATSLAKLKIFNTMAKSINDQQ